MTERRTPGSAPDAARYYNPDPDYLRQLVDRSGLSQRECARRLGIADRNGDCRSFRAYLDAGSGRPAPYLVQVGLELLAGMPD